MAVFRPGGSENQKAALKEKYRNMTNWLSEETTLLKCHGFNGTDAWSNIDILRENNTPLVYSIIVSPMESYKSQHRRRYFKYEEAGWQGYRYDLTMVFDPEFDAHVEKAIAPITQYANDKNLLVYSTDNELPWVKDALYRI